VSERREVSVGAAGLTADPVGVILTAMVRLWRYWVMSLAFLVLAGCGSAMVASTAPRSVRGAAGTAAQRCARLARLLPGVKFAAWHLGAVRFSSSLIGVGLTTSAIGCDYRLPTGGIEVGQHEQVTQLATTSDGGRFWELTGVPVPATATGDAVSPEQLVATSSSDLWAVVGKGRLVATSDGGARWTVQPLPGLVSQIEVSGGSVWALTCVGVRPYAFACHPQLWRARTTGSGWSEAGLPQQTAADPQSAQLAVLSRSLIVDVIGSGRTGSFELLHSDDLGSRWQARPVSWHGQPCDNGSLASAPPVTAWLLCNTGAIGGSGDSDKILLGTTDGGQTWRTVSSVTLTGQSRSGQLQRAEPVALAAGSPNRLWLSGDNDLTVSSDGGRRWSQVRGANPHQSPTTFDVLDASHAWMLGFDSGLWLTTNGVRWHRVGPLHTY
jgi:photosystem II stability/assembly factor-like uncharacterized protein